MQSITRRFVLVAALALPAVLPLQLFAQWPDFPSRNVPKTADGKPNLKGPVPRTADGHPDLTGVWEYYRERGPVANAGGNVTVPQANNGTVPAPRTPGVAPVVPGASTGLGPVSFSSIPFFNIGVDVKGGLPFTPWAAQIRKARSADNNKDNPDAHCLPIGLMQLHLHPQPRKIIQTQDLIVILYEANGGVRQIFMDGRKLPTNNPQPWWYGYSIGHWDGDTLVVETNGFRDDVWLDVEGSPLTESGKMTERIRRVDFGNLDIQVTVEDPKAYTKSWTVPVKQTILLNEDLIEFVCGENEKDAPHLTEK